MKRILIAAAAWLIAAPAFAENYNLVCPIAEMGTAQAGGATVPKRCCWSCAATVTAKPIALRPVRPNCRTAHRARRAAASAG